jgi:hypothetical protein
MEIKFNSIFTDIPEEFYPKPAFMCLPDWYKETKPYVERKSINNDGHDNTLLKTIKKCIPVFDSITSGYIIFSAMDIKVSSLENGSYYIEWPNTFNIISNKVSTDPIQFHDFDQLTEYPFLEKRDRVPKFINPWGIKTPRGYSVFVTTPMHRKLPFEILPGIVDTDKNHAPINFPFLFKEKNWNGFIPSGTPIAQIIPFKRDSWKMKIEEKEEDKKISLQQVFRMQSSYKSPYKKVLWTKKDFK